MARLAPLAALVALVASVVGMPAPAAADHSSLDLVTRGPSGTPVSAGLVGGWRGFTDDGEHGYLFTNASLLPSDTDTTLDTYDRFMFAGTTTHATAGRQNGPISDSAFVTAVSIDGERAFFDTRQQLVPEDLDTESDVYERSRGVTRLISPAGIGAFSSHADVNAASPDGRRVFFETHEQLVPQDDCCSDDVYEARDGTVELVRPPDPQSNGSFNSFWGLAGDGAVFFKTDLPLVPEDGDSVDDIYEKSTTGQITLRSLDEVAGDTPDATFPFEFTSDGDRAFISTMERLDPADSDSLDDVYENSGGDTKLVTPGTAWPAPLVAASDDGDRVVVATIEGFVPNDFFEDRDLYEFPTAGGPPTLLSTGPLDEGEDFSVLEWLVSADGSTAAFSTKQRLVLQDTDSSTDLYVRRDGATSLASVGPAGGNGAIDVDIDMLQNPQSSISDDGRRIFFLTTEQLTSDDVDSALDVYEYSDGQLALLSPGTGSQPVEFQGASEDGTRAFFSTNEMLIAGEPPTLGNTYVKRALADHDIAVTTTDAPDPAPAGGTVTYTMTVRNDTAIDAPGVQLFDYMPASTFFVSMSSSQGECQRYSGVITCALGPLAGGAQATVQLTVKPKRARVLRNRVTVRRLEGSDRDMADNTDEETTLMPNIEPIPRPGGATPLRVPLVPLFQECSSPNTTHTPPLALPSCSPPQMASVLTMRNGFAVNSARYVAVPGDNNTPEDEADLGISASITDVKCAAPAFGCDAEDDYTRSLLLTSKMRITDLANGPEGADAGTATDEALSVPVPCSTLGSCSIATSADTLVPGLINEEKRTVVSLLGVEVWDAGLNGTGYGPANCPFQCGNGDENVYLTQGVFTP